MKWIIIAMLLLIAPLALADDTNSGKSSFKVGPVVKIRPVNDEITSAEDGLIELFMSNPKLNDITLHVESYISVPSGFHVTGEGFGQAEAAGTVYGSFDVPPGTSRTVYINVKSEKVGEFMVHFSGIYYPKDNKERYNPISLTHPMTVREPSRTIETQEKNNSIDWDRILSTEISWSLVAMVFVVLLGLALILR